MTEIRRGLAVVTGASSGIGYETSLSLAKMNYSVVIICRNKIKGEQTKKEIQRESKNEDITLMLCDLSSFTSIKEFIRLFKLKFGGSKIDILVNNAGLGYISEKMITKDGYEISFQVKYLGHFFITMSLMDNIKKSKGGRIICLSGGYHKKQIILDDWKYEKNEYNPNDVGIRINNAVIMFTQILARKLLENNIKNVTINCLHPGAVNTNIQSTLPTKFKLMYYMCKPFFLSAKNGAKNVVYLCTNEKNENVNGKYFNKKREAKPYESCEDIDYQEKLWKKSFEICELENVLK